MKNKITDECRARLLVFEMVHREDTDGELRVRVECDGTQHYRIEKWSVPEVGSDREFICAPCAGEEICEAQVRRGFDERHALLNAAKVMLTRWDQTMESLAHAEGVLSGEQLRERHTSIIAEMALRGFAELRAAVAKAEAR